ncbi:hypothetical protein BDZ88DRAFT_180706 [Geranomyces variabilis]|nr:hypothetical protein BDZ88DRAFT_180706 [Geranomyces variabilis]
MVEDRVLGKVVPWIALVRSGHPCSCSLPSGSLSSESRGSAAVTLLLVLYACVLLTSEYCTDTLFFSKKKSSAGEDVVLTSHCTASGQKSETPPKIFADRVHCATAVRGLRLLSTGCKSLECGIWKVLRLTGVVQRPRRMMMPIYLENVSEQIKKKSVARKAAMHQLRSRYYAPTSSTRHSTLPKSIVWPRSTVH